MQQRPSHQLSCLHPGRGGRASRKGCRRSNPFQPRSFKTGILGWRGCLGLAEGYSAKPLGKPCNTPSRGALCATGRQSVIVSITSSASALTLPLWCTIQGGCMRCLRNGVAAIRFQPGSQLPLPAPRSATQRWHAQSQVFQPRRGRAIAARVFAPAMHRHCGR